MMHRCSSSCHGSMVGPCSCGLFHSQSNVTTTTSSAFSMLFSHNPSAFDHEYSENMYSFAPSSSSVDCTLSLGTPSTRLTNDISEKRVVQSHERRSSYMSNFCWDILQPKQHTPSPPSSAHKSTRGGSNGSNTNSTDPLVARRCANCDTTSTPLWRNGPRGPKSLCNACGIRFKKEERRASAAAATANGGRGGGGGMDTQHMINSTASWVHHSQPPKMPCFSSAAYGNELRFIEDDDRDSDATAIPFLPWRLNVADRPSLVHDFTR
ncbi:PREDICTED: GATA transcription factor 19-like [Nicotiana attenuata]|uniref:Gata transcription factor 18 n=1 Tax=Nicotiana attenuata TaxID=49451 RepID=A0A314L501_NICAT|nr:PREDICTED: GATA transcription factor 19-like [Nicotiana attenuata]OIT36623.1 gata transcription factor 18 [Nicotiana attenuata]